MQPTVGRCGSRLVRWIRGAILSRADARRAECFVAGASTSRGLALAGIVALAAGAHLAGAITLLKQFPANSSNGARPGASMIADGAGNLYGTAYSGGAFDQGVIFKVRTDGTGFAVLHSLGGPDGANPYASLLLDGAGNLYGTTESGGASGDGVVFKLRTDGTGFAVLHSFAGGTSDGMTPEASLVLDDAGNLYGTTSFGGASNHGVVFALRTDGTGFSLLHSFGYSDGANPYAPLDLDGAGSLCSTTPRGGALQAGVVFCLKTDGTGFAVLHAFGGRTSDGANPYSALVRDGAGVLYGTASSGGAFSHGAVFTLRIDGTGYSLLHSFAGGPTDGGYPYSPLVLDGVGNLYGTTFKGGAANVGAVFSLKTDGTGYSLLHSFAGSPSDGAYPYASVLLDGAANLYGTTFYGGASAGGAAFTLKTDGTGFALLHSFEGPVDGADPRASLVIDGAGNLTGTTYSGGESDQGTMFRIRSDGTGFVVLHAFSGRLYSDGANPRAALVLDSAGNRYGTTSQGGTLEQGAVVALNADGTAFTVLHSFEGAPDDGASPYASLLLDSGGYLYGVTRWGGSYGSYGGGVVFKLKTDGSAWSVMHSFEGSDGCAPIAPLISDNAGNLYGTTLECGMSGDGIVFAINSDGTPFTGISVLHSFAGGSADGASPSAALVLDPAGNLYGTTSEGGASGSGVVFSLKTDGSGYRVLHSFAGASDGANPTAALALDGAGSLYGTASTGGPSGRGVVYTLKTDGTGFAVLHAFAGGVSDGADPYAGVTLDGAGSLYGTTAHGGASDFGTVFRLPITGDQPPAFTSAPGTVFSVGGAGRFTVKTSGYPAPTVAETGSLPAGVTFTDNGEGSSTIAGTPAAGSAGTYPLTLTAHNGIGADATQSFALTVWASARRTRRHVSRQP